MAFNIILWVFSSINCIDLGTEAFDILVQDLLICDLTYIYIVLVTVEFYVWQ